MHVSLLLYVFNLAKYLCLTLRPPSVLSQDSTMHPTMVEEVPVADFFPLRKKYADFQQKNTNMSSENSET